jgi:hypothetical protein
MISGYTAKIYIKPVHKPYKAIKHNKPHSEIQRRAERENKIK